MPVIISNEIEIAVSCEVLFNYVTQPWLWHEWHPTSKSANSSHSFLATGDEFDEMIEVRPLGALPPRLKRHTNYVVTESVPMHTWQVEGKMKNGWLRIRYDFERAEEPRETTMFYRTLEFDVSGANRLIRPLISSQMRSISQLALQNLKQKLESPRDA